MAGLIKTVVIRPREPHQCACMQTQLRRGAMVVRTRWCRWELGMSRIRGSWGGRSLRFGEVWVDNDDVGCRIQGWMESECRNIGGGIESAGCLNVKCEVKVNEHEMW